MKHDCSYCLCYMTTVAVSVKPLRSVTACVLCHCQTTTYSHRLCSLSVLNYYVHSPFCVLCQCCTTMYSYRSVFPVSVKLLWTVTVLCSLSVLNYYGQSPPVFSVSVKVRCTVTALCSLSVLNYYGQSPPVFSVSVKLLCIVTACVLCQC